jgi:DNA helicase-2/ATP-dependent DNA helicase PcrA
MTLHAAKGLEFDVVFLPGWEEGLFPHQRSLDENGAAGLEEERRLAYVGITRARRKVAIYHAANRRVRGLWQNSRGSRFLDELPEAHVDFEESSAPSGWGYGASRFDAMTFAGSAYTTPGWRRGQESGAKSAAAPRAADRVIEGRASAAPRAPSDLRAGARVIHAKFGPGSIFAVDGGKLTVDFDKAGRKLVQDSFVSLLT